MELDHANPAIDELMRFARLRGVDVIILEARWLVDDAYRAKLEAFVLACWEQGLDVELMLAGHHLARVASHSSALEAVRKIVSFWSTLSNSTVPVRNEASWCMNVMQANGFLTLPPDTTAVDTGSSTTSVSSGSEDSSSPDTITIWVVILAVTTLLGCGAIAVYYLYPKCLSTTMQSASRDGGEGIEADTNLRASVPRAQINLEETMRLSQTQNDRATRTSFHSMMDACSDVDSLSDVEINLPNERRLGASSHNNDDGARVTRSSFDAMMSVNKFELHSSID